MASQRTPAWRLIPVTIFTLGLAIGGLSAGCAAGPSQARTAGASPAVVPAGTVTSQPPLPSPAGTPSASPAGSAKPKPGTSRSPVPATTKPRTPGPTKPPEPTASPAVPVGPFDALRRTGTASVALTFDDGPDPTYTPQILDLLKAHGVKATFCVIGSRARDYPDLIRRIVGEGHTLCNHSWQHLMNLGQRTWSYQDWDLRNTNDAIHLAVPGYPIKYFRAPGGNFTVPLIALARQLGMTPLYWAVDPRDWDAATFGTGTAMVDHIVSTVENNTSAGSIVLSHDRAKPDTVAAYQILIPWLLARFTLIALPTG